MSVSDLLQRKRKNFALWLPGVANPKPELVITTFQAGSPPSSKPIGSFALMETAPGLWEIPASDCGLADETVYHYWFEVNDTAPSQSSVRVRRTDPLAYTIDWRVTAPAVPGIIDSSAQPASVILFQKGDLLACDPGGEVLEFPEPDPAGLGLPPNNFLVIYELPPRWAQQDGDRLTGVGTFRDVQALVDSQSESPNFDGIRLLQKGGQYLLDLGVNALEMLPIHDSRSDREWGYGTTNYAAPDYDLGFPETFSWPTANTDLANLVRICHLRGIRVILDLVLGYGSSDPNISVNDPAFHYPAASKTTTYKEADPEQRSSRYGENRKDWGGRLWRYIQIQPGIYDPVSGQTSDIVPARQFHKVALERWIRDFHIDGLRLDSVETIANYDFVQQIRDHGHAVFEDRWGSSTPDAKAHFHVVGEELSVPMDLLTQERLDGLWSEKYKQRLRYAILGQNHPSDSNFEQTIRCLVDSCKAGFSDGAKAIIYPTSHDVEGYRNERLFNFLENNAVANKEERLKLAFTCLLTSVGIPMFLAGEEFGDQTDLSVGFPQKKFDAVNFERLQYAQDQVANRLPIDLDHPDQTWRERLFTHVQRLVALRKAHPALGLNDTDFIHVDFDHGKRVLAWRRGDTSNPVVVVANFSAWGTDVSQPNAEYRVSNWPSTPVGKVWFEVTQQQTVTDPRWVGAWALYPWQATVWVLRP